MPKYRVTGEEIEIDIKANILIMEKEKRISAYVTLKVYIYKTRKRG